MKDLGSEQVQFRCPECYDDKALLDDNLKCSACGIQFSKIKDIPNLVLKDSFKPRAQNFNNMN